jgi:endoglucanase
MTYGRSRREFLRLAGAGALGGAAVPGVVSAGEAQAYNNPLPRWRGFNLTNFFNALGADRWKNCRVRREDCRWIRQMGFNFIRLPMDYWLWVDSDWRETRKMDPDAVMNIDEEALQAVDRAVQVARENDLHISLNFHRAPGYCVNNPDREPFSLWKDERAQQAFVHHWGVFAERYSNIPSSDLSFNLVNEPRRPKKGRMTPGRYASVMSRAAEKIWSVSPDRTVIVDGLTWAHEPVEALTGERMAQAVHGYVPMRISHYRASWINRSEEWAEPTWPLRNEKGEVTYGREELEEYYRPWGQLVRSGVGVHCGELGCYRHTPHDVFLAWMEDVLQILKGYDIGYALWNFRGSFGVLDTGRDDVDYEDWHGHNLDRELLDLLQKY